MASDEENEPQSRYKPVVIPEFKSAIPPHLLAKLPEADRYLVEMVSKAEQQNAWLVVAVRDENQAKMELDVRLQKVEKWKTMLCNKWSLVAAIIILVAPVLVKVWIERTWSHSQSVPGGTQLPGAK